MTVQDNREIEVAPDEAEKLQQFASVPLCELAAKNPNFLVFPTAFGVVCDDLDQAPLFTMRGGDRFCAGNVVGFFGVAGVDVRIISRFDPSAERQYFFQYMLQEVLGLHMLDLPTTSGGEAIWDFLIYLFPAALKAAYRQGVFRAYRTIRYDDDRVKGVADISRFIRNDMPFSGKVSYTARVRSENNPVNQLIRHVIELIWRKHPRLLRVDEDVRAAVQAIVAATPDYSPRSLTKVIADNLCPVRHPYLTLYTTLQKLCLKILRHERVSYGDDGKRLNGIVFDAAWLWEEYLATFLKPRGVIHPENKTKRNPEYLYAAKGGHGRVWKECFPDFVDPSNSAIYDAKYKPLESGISIPDRFQLVSYLHIKKYDKGLLLYPQADRGGLDWEGCLNGYGGWIGSAAFRVPKVETGVDDFRSFAKQMAISRDEFLAILSKVVPGQEGADKRI